MRRLPIYFLLDVSESMAGKPLSEVEKGISSVLRELKRDPHALETAHLSVVAFAGKAKTLVPLMDLLNFSPPQLPIGIGTNWGRGFAHLADCFSKEIQPTRPDRKGDWRPLVFFFTDGLPTDDAEIAIREWQNGWGKKATMVCVAIGGQVDLSLLGKLSEHVLVFNPDSPEAWNRFFKWVSASIKVSSQSLAGGQADFNLAPKDAGIMTDIPGASSGKFLLIDQRVATFLARCSKDKLPYLIKYLESGHNSFQLEGCFPLGKDLDSLMEPGSERTSSVVQIDKLSGNPVCPVCGSPHGLAKCSCGGILCLPEDSSSVECPWCAKKQSIGPEGNTSFDLNRTQG